MSNLEDKIKNKYGTQGGWSVPEGYFDNVFKEIEAKLPDTPVRPHYVEMTRWQRFKPYVYLAAMFAGIWLMMQVFHTAAGDSTLSLDNPPAQVAMAMAEPEIVDSYYLPASMDDLEAEHEIIGEYSDFSEFESDFNSTN